MTRYLGIGRLEDVRQRLNRHGRRMTPQRAAILEVLRRHPDHPTAEEIYEEVQQNLPRISLGTVYRNLQVLVEEGYATRLAAVQGHHRFDGQTTDHHHVICRSCGRVANVSLEQDPELLVAVTRQSGYELLSHRMEFEGVCGHCSD